MPKKKRPARFLQPAAIFTVIVFLLYLSACRPNEELPRDKLYQYNPFAWQTRVENYNFQTTVSEQQCFNGTIPPNPDSTTLPTIPRVVHFTWGLKGDGAFTFPLYLAIKAALATIQPDEVKIHYTHLDRDNAWFLKLEHNLTLVHHDTDDIISSTGLSTRDSMYWHVAHVSDVLRLQVLAAEGGIYLDSDAYALQPFDSILSGARDVVLAHEGGNRYGMANAVIVAKKGARFVQRWLGRYESFNNRNWNYHSVVLPKKLADRYPLEMCALSPTAFFWPLWTDSHVEFMHKRLDADEVLEVENRMRRYGGALFEDQLVYHAWSHQSYDRYMSRLTPEIVLEEDTRFNILMRRFID